MFTDVLFFEKVVLNPECKSIHENRNNNDDQYKLKSLKLINPT